MLHPSCTGLDKRDRKVGKDGTRAEWDGRDENKFERAGIQKRPSGLRDGTR